MQYLMLIHDLGKHQEIAAATHGVAALRGEVDHDEVMRVLLEDQHLTDHYLPTLATLPPASQQQIHQVLLIDCNLGQFMQAEAPAAGLEGLRQVEDPTVRDWWALHAMLDIAGALGHQDAQGSRILTSPFYHQFRAAYRATVDNDTTMSSRERYDNYLAERAQGYGLDPEDLSDPAVYTQTRLGCMLRYSTPEQYQQLAAGYAGLTRQAQAILEAELMRDGVDKRATLIYYGPALLAALLGESAYRGDHTRALDFFAHVAQEAHIADRAARQAGRTGVATAMVGDLARQVATGQLDVETAQVCFQPEEGNPDVLLATIEQPPQIDLEALPRFDGEQLRGQRVLYVGMGGGSDGVQAAMLGQRLQARYGAELAAVASVRTSEKPLAGVGRRLGRHTVEITADTRAVGSWRFLEGVLAQDDQMTAPTYIVNANDAGTIRDELAGLMAYYQCDAVIGIDTGGDVLYGVDGQEADQVNTSPDQDSMVLQAIQQLPGDNRYITVIAPGIDSPTNAQAVLAAADGRVIMPTDEDKAAIADMYRRWRMDGSASEEGLYGKTPLALLAALAGRSGRLALGLPKGAITADNNPWRAYLEISQAMGGMVVMRPDDLARQVGLGA